MLKHAFLEWGVLIKEKSKGNLTLSIAIVVVLIAIIAAYLLLSPSNNQAAAQNISAPDPYAHLGNASFALIAPLGVLGNNSQFVTLAKARYNFKYAVASNATALEKSQFVVVVANKSEIRYLQIAEAALNKTALDSALNYTKGVVIERNNVWGGNQSVFLLVGYNNSNTLKSALLSFFINGPVSLPRQAGIRFVNFSGNASSVSHLKRSGGDPIMDAYLDGSYELGPHDKWLTPPYNYYDQFAYLTYWAPMFSSLLGIFGVGGNSSGTGLPMSASLCFPPPPPPDGTSLCIGEYFAMPMFQFGTSPPQPPQWSLDTGDCLWAEDCIDTEGWAASGLNPQLPYQEIPSVQYGFTVTGSPVPPSMTGTFGPLGAWDPITWWNWGPGGSNLNTGGLVQTNLSSTSAQSEVNLLKNAGVEVFSAPYEETPFGNFTGYNSTNASVSYSCGAGYCGAFFDYAIYALMNESSTLPKSAQTNSSLMPGTGYYSIFQPVTLAAQKKVRTGTKIYYFSYWSVYSEVGSNQYHQTFNTSSATFEMVGPTQAQAVYTSSSAPGTVTVSTGYSGFGSGGCTPLQNCSGPGISGVTVSFTDQNGQQVYSNTTGANGKLVTPVLQGGCYNINAQKSGYSLIAGPNPVCVNGPSGVLVQTLGLFIYNVSWPVAYPYAAAPANKVIPMNLTLLYAQLGKPAGNTTIGVNTDSGSVSGTYPPPANGSICTRWFNGYNYQTLCGSVKNYALGRTNNTAATSTFMWHTGSTPGIYYLNFTPLVTSAGVPLPPLYGFTHGWTYSMPVVVYSGSYPVTALNISLANSTIHVAPGTSFTDNVTVRLCNTFNIGLNRSLPCILLAPYMANITLRFINDRPTNTTTSFTPDPAPANTKAFDDATSLKLSFGNGVRTGIYSARITASMATPTAIYNATVPLAIYVSNSSTPSTTTTVSTSPTTTIGGGSGYGALNVTVFFNGSPAAAANISAFSPGVQVYRGWYTGSNGEYNSGYTIVPGSYEVDATYANITNSTNYINVTAGAVTHVFISIHGIANSTTSASSSSSSSTTSTSTTASTTSSASSTSSATTTIQQGYYTCNECYHVIIAGFSCPSSCPTSSQCAYGGFECT